MNDDSNVTPLPRRDIIGGHVSDGDLTRVVNLLLESQRMLAARIDASERWQAQQRAADAAQAAAHQAKSEKAHRDIVRQMQGLADAMHALRQDVTVAIASLRESFAAATGQPVSEQGKLRKAAPIVAGGMGLGAVIVEVLQIIRTAMGQ